MRSEETIQRNGAKGTVGAPVLEAQSIYKSYGSVEALKGVTFQVFPGEIVGLVGDNGAGKSTLIGCLSGVITPDAGEVRLDGEAITFTGPGEARERGVETVYQDLSLALELELTANIFLGREIKRKSILGKLGMLDWSAMRPEAHRALSDLGINVASPRRPTSTLSGGQRQAVAIARAVKWAQKIILLDEPTAALGVTQSAVVLDVLQRVRLLGIPVVFISHNLDNVFAITDRIVVLRLGAVAGVFHTSNTNHSTVVHAITGAALDGARQQ